MNFATQLHVCHWFIVFNTWYLLVPFIKAYYSYLENYLVPTQPCYLCSLCCSQSTKVQVLIVFMELICHVLYITLFRSITMLCGIFSYSIWIWGIFRIILSIPHNIVMDLNNVMYSCPSKPCYISHGKHFSTLSVEPYYNIIQPNIFAK